MDGYPFNRVIVRVIYLTWGETPRASGVYGSQVVAQLDAIQRELVGGELMLVAGLPLIHSGLVRERLAYPAELREIRRRLPKVPFRLLWLPAVQTFVYARNWQMRFLLTSGLSRFAKIVRVFSPDIVHCRSYLAALVALRTREATGIDFKVVFDARGLWPEEGVIKGRYAENSDSFRHWKDVEQALLSKADVTVAVSDPMKAYYETLGVARCERIYLSAPTSILGGRDREGGEKVKKNGQGNVLCYVGALASGTWHKPETLFDLYRVFRTRLDEPRLLIVSQSNRREILAYARRMLGDSVLNEIEFETSASTDKLAELMARADFGALPYMVPHSECEMRVANTVLAIKTTEYLAAGLPLIVNRHCGGAAEFIRQHGLGVIYDPADIESSLTREAIAEANTKPVRQRAQAMAEDLFDYQKNAARYIELYHAVCRR